MRVNTKTGLAGVFILLVTLGCGGSQEPVKDPYLPPTETKSEPMVGEAPECVDENEEPVRCTRDDECCKGFVCGIDPELSSRIKHCIYAGK